MISGTSNISRNLDPINGQLRTRGPRILWFLLYKNTSTKTRKYMGAYLKHICLHIWTTQKCQIWKRQAPKNDEDPSNQIFKILNMGPISIKKHEWIFLSMGPISI